MESDQAHISNRIIYSGWDFQQALSALTFLLEDCEFEKKYNVVDLRRFRCYETSMVISFSRPFKVGRGRKELDLRELSFELTDEESNIKSKLIFLRDKLIGHSDEEEMEFSFGSYQVDNDDSTRMPIERFHEALHLTEEEFYRAERLLHRLIKSIANYKFKYAQSNPQTVSKKRT